MCLYIIMPFSSNFYLFVFGYVIENRMTQQESIALLTHSNPIPNHEQKRTLE